MRSLRLFLLCLVFCANPLALGSQRGEQTETLPSLATLKQLKFTAGPVTEPANATSHQALEKAIQSFKLFRAGAPQVKGWRWNERPKTRGPRETSVYNAAVNSVVYIEAAVETAFFGAAKTATGTGTILAPDDLVLTNYHVVRTAHAGKHPIMVYLKPAKSVDPVETLGYLAHVQFFDPAKDLAALRFDQTPPYQLAKLKLGAMSNLAVGQTVHLIGHPLGETWSFSTGIISQIRPKYKTMILAEKGAPPIPFEANALQLQTAVNPGNSGGPLLDDGAAVVGVISFGMDEAQNLNYAVAADEVRSFLEAYQQEVSRPTTQAFVSATSVHRLAAARRWSGQKIRNRRLHRVHHPWTRRRSERRRR